MLNSLTVVPWDPVGLRLHCYCTTYTELYSVLYMAFPPIKLLDLLAGFMLYSILHFIAVVQGLLYTWSTNNCSAKYANSKVETIFLESYIATIYPVKKFWPLACQPSLSTSSGHNPLRQPWLVQSGAALLFREFSSKLKPFSLYLLPLVFTLY